MFLLFENNQNLFAVDINDVKSIFLTKKIYPLPFFENILVGVSNIKGDLYPIFNINYLFKFPNVSISRKLILLHNEYNFILTSDGKIKIESDLGEKIENSNNNEFITNIFKKDEQLVYNLNLENIKKLIAQTLSKEAQ
ncbi:chemotaxis protein CheW [Deferribacter thermophilus]|uniref:chemotaxis protein CheW n=1 Tax=Deferribacter thermophilus TaxID=53573 RepID=UPI003C1A61D4